MLKNDNYVVIQSFMVNELNLKGNELLVYAIIYGFTQAENQVFSGSLQYLADWCNSTKQGIIKSIKSLIDKGLVIKKTSNVNGIRVCEYYTTKFNTIKQSLMGYSTEFNGGIKQSLTNNIDNTINNNIDNIIISNNIMQSSQKKETKYTKCLAEIEKYTNDLELQNKLKEYLNVRLSIKDKPFTVNNWSSLLNKLSDMKGNQIEIVNQSIDKKWATFVDIVPRKNYKYTGPNVFGEFNDVVSKPYTDKDAERDKKWRDENGIKSF